MALETATHIANLISTNPAGGDDLSQGDDHLRMIKQVLLTDLPLDAPATTLGMNILKSATAEAVRSFLSASISPYRNRVVNGDFKVDTRNKGATTTISNGSGSIKYTCDKWFAWCSGGGNMQITRAIGAGTSIPQLLIASATGAGAWNFGTRLNKLDVTDLVSPTVSKTITLSASIDTPINLTWTMFVPNLSPGTYGTIGAFTKTQLATGTFVAGVGTYSAQITLSAGSAMNRGVEIVFSAGGLTSAQNIFIYKVQLEAGAIANADIVFESIDEAMQKMRCQHHCREILANIRAPSTSNGQIFANSLVWPEMYSAPTPTLVTSGVSNLSTGKVVATPTAVGARFEHTSTGAGDCYSLENVYLLEAEIQ